jgi:hypothetical protein
MGTPLAESPLGAIQVIEARAEAYESQGGINRRGHQSAKVSYILQMDSIKFIITESLMSVIQNKRLYRVYAVNDQGVWIVAQHGDIGIGFQKICGKLTFALNGEQISGNLF